MRLAQRPGMAEVIDAAVVAHEPAVLPNVQGNRSVPAYLHGTMDVAADNAFDLWMPLDDCPECVPPAKAEIVQHANSLLKRRVVHEDQRWFLRRPSEGFVQPRKPETVKASTGVVLDRTA